MYKQAELVPTDVMRKAGRDSFALAQELATSPDPQNLWAAASAFLRSGFTATNTGEAEFALAWLPRARAIFTECGDLLGDANVLCALVRPIHTPEDSNRAIPMLEASILVARRLKSKFTLSLLTSSLAYCHFQVGNYHAMAVTARAARVLYRETGDQRMEIWPARMSAVGDYYCDDFLHAHTGLVKGMQLSIDRRDFNGMCASIIYLGGIAVKTGSVTRGVTLLGFIERQFEGFFIPMDWWDRVEYDRLVAQVKSAMAPEEFDALWQHGRAMSLDDAVAEARTAVA